MQAATSDSSRPTYLKKFLRSNPTPEYCLNDFILRQIGKGTFGLVYKAVHKSTMKNFAIKQVFKQGNQLTIHHELTVMYSLDCPHIVRLYDHFEDEANVYLLLQLVEGKQLYEGLLSKKQFLQHEEIVRLIEQLCDALEYLHSRQIIHRDIKPENIMLTREGVLKLTDFGAANFLRENQCRRTFIGTPQYIAPEIIFEEPQSFATDVWSVGVFLYELATMKLPFDAPNPGLIYENIKKSKFQFPVCLVKELELKDLISRMIVRDPTKRLTLSEIVSHPWIKRHSKRGSGKEATVETSDIQSTTELSENIPQGQFMDAEAVRLEGRISQLEQELVKDQPQPRDDRYKFELERRISMLEKKLQTANGFIEKKQSLINYNGLRAKQLEQEVFEFNILKAHQQSTRQLIDRGNQDYLAALEARKRLKHRELGLQYEIVPIGITQNVRKSNIARHRKVKLLGNTESTTPTREDVPDALTDCYRSSRVLSTTNADSEVNPLQRTLSYSVQQIDSFLADIKERKRRLRQPESLTLEN